MALLSKLTVENLAYTRNAIPTSTNTGIPIIDLSKPDSKHLLVQACEEFGFFKVISHRVPMEFISRLESQALNFFSLSFPHKQKAGPPNPFGYGNKCIGQNGDVGWVEYLLLNTNQECIPQEFLSVSGHNPDEFRCALSDYVREVKRMACEILEMMADGLKIQPRNVLSKMLMDEQSDSVFRVNHYPPCPDMNESVENNDRVGFGEHTDPQIISVLRSNNTSGLQISLQDGTWISVPPDQNSFFINVGDSLQVMTNGRFRSVRHRVLANSMKARVSMIYFGGPPLSEMIAPLPSLVKGERSLYKEFTWFEYKKSAFRTRLADNRLLLFEKIAA